MLRHYAAMRDYDAFTAPSDYVHEFYAEYIWDTSCFNPSNGVDSVLLSPMDKKAAKKELAERVGDDRITTVPTVSVTSYSPSEINPPVKIAGRRKEVRSREKKSSS